MFWIFFRSIFANTEKVILISKAVVTFHSFLIKKRLSQNEKYSYYPVFYIDYESRSGIFPGSSSKAVTLCDGIWSIQKRDSNNYSKSGKEVCDLFESYFYSAKEKMKW